MAVAETDDPAAIVGDILARARRVETPCGDGHMVWHSWGNGPPLLLAHGSHGAWSHWIRNIDALAQRYSLWVPDLPGNGESPMPPEQTHASMSAMLAEGLATLIGPDVAVDAAGFSFGGVVLAHFAALYPARVRRLVIVGSGGLDTPLGAIRLGRVRGLEGAAREAANRANLLALMLHAPESVDALALFLQERNAFRGRIDATSFVLPDRLIEALPDVAAQVDAIWGEYDLPHPDPAVQAAALRRVRPDVDFRTIAGAGHWVMYERAEAFNAALIELLGAPLR